MEKHQYQEQHRQVEQRFIETNGGACVLNRKMESAGLPDIEGKEDETAGVASWSTVYCEAGVNVS